MKWNIRYSLLLLVITFTSCNTEKKNEEMHHQSVSVFPIGEIINSKNFSGTVWLYMMGARDSTLHASFGYVTFELKARTNWHSHPGGQILFITQGKGYYQAKGQPARLLHKGDYVEIPPNVVHWHGAAADSEFAHIAVSLNTDKGGAVWLEPVTDDEYNDIITK
jgi:quercetin dioxygenase-like cupin family protein